MEVLGGVIDPSKLRFPFSHMPAADVRDREAIRRWAAELPERLGAARRVEAAGAR